MQRWPEFFAETTFLTDRFHGANHLCSDEFKYNCHGLRGRAEFQGPDNTSVSEQINRLMSRFDRTEQRATINTGMLVYDFYIQFHNADLLKKWPKMRAAQVCKSRWQVCTRSRQTCSLVQCDALTPGQNHDLLLISPILLILYRVQIFRTDQQPSALQLRTR
jgi:hypothetical protein